METTPERQMRCRTWTSQENMTLSELEEVARSKAPEGAVVTASRGVFLRWETPETDEELADRIKWDQYHKARRDEWELKAYEKWKRILEAPDNQVELEVKLRDHGSVDAAGG